MDAFGETTTCCMPLSYHIHQQQVKVLVHNTAIPPYPTGPNPYHQHAVNAPPTNTPTITLIPEPTPADAPTGSQSGSPRDTKPPPPAPPASANTTATVGPPRVEGGQDVTSSSAGEMATSGSCAPARRKYMTGGSDQPENGRTYKPERFDEGETGGGSREGGGEDGVRGYKTESGPTPPTCPTADDSRQAPPEGATVTHKEEKIDVIDDVPEDKMSTPERQTLGMGNAPIALPLPPPPSSMTSSAAPLLLLTPDTVTTKVEKRSPDTVSMAAAAEKCPQGAAPLAADQCKSERCPTPPPNAQDTTPCDVVVPPTEPKPPSAAPLPPPPPAAPVAGPVAPLADPAGEQGGPSRLAEKVGKKG